MITRALEQGLTLGGLGIWTMVGMMAIAFVRSWPVITRAAADARKARADATKVEAEASRISAETDDVVIAALERQIQRLDQRVELLEHAVQDCHKDRDLALAAARILWDRLNTIAPDDETVAHLREYLTRPPALSTPRSMIETLDKLK